MTTIVYARRSSETGDDYSLDTQIEACEKYAALRGLAGDVQVRRENFTGTVHLRERDAGGEVWQLLKDRKADTLVVYSVDRLSRAKLRHALTLIDDLLELGIRLHAIDVGEITNTDDIGLIIRSWQAGEERRKIVERLMRGKLGKAQAGKWPGDQHPPYGYRRVGIGKTARLVVEPNEAQVVVEMYDWYAGDGERTGLRGIIDKLFALGIQSPQGRPSWGTASVRRVLTSEIYHGVITYRGVPIPLPELRIVPDDLWQAAQQQRETNQRLSARHRRHEYLMAGYLVCGECGSKMYGVKHTARRDYFTYMYRCSQMLKPPALRTCTVPWVSVRKIDDLVWEFVQTHLEPERLAAGLAALDAQEQAVDHTSDLARLDDEIKRLSGRLRVLLRSVRGDEGPEAQAAFDAELDTIRADITRATDKRQALRTDDQTLAARRAERAALTDQLADIRAGVETADFQFKRDALEIIGVEVTVGHREDGHKTITIRSAIAPEETLEVPRSWRKKKRATQGRMS